jgi:hypothetical protein
MLKILYTENEIKLRFNFFLETKYKKLKGRLTLLTPLVGIPLFLVKRNWKRALCITGFLILTTFYATIYMLHKALFLPSIPLIILLLLFQVPLLVSLIHAHKIEYVIVIPRLRIFHLTNLDAVIEHELKHATRFLK